MINLLSSFILGYLVGTIPTAYLVVKRVSNVDIRTAGSGNVGGRNALDVTGKKSVGIIVVFIDVLKGILSVVLASYFFNDTIMAISTAMVGSVVGHCYPVWLKFKGGRGLATAAGSFLITSWFFVFLWLGLYFLSSKFLKNIHLSSVVALVATPILAWLIPEQWLSYLITGIFSKESFLLAGTIVILVCLTKHIQPLQELYAKQNS